MTFIKQLLKAFGFDFENIESDITKYYFISNTLIVPLEALASGKISYEEFKKNFEKIVDFMKPK